MSKILAANDVKLADANYNLIGMIAFIITVKTDNAGTSNDDQFTIPCTGAGYNYDVDWGDSTSIT